MEYYLLYHITYCFSTFFWFFYIFSKNEVLPAVTVTFSAMKHFVPEVHEHLHFKFHYHFTSLINDVQTYSPKIMSRISPISPNRFFFVIIYHPFQLYNNFKATEMGKVDYIWCTDGIYTWYHLLSFLFSHIQKDIKNRTNFSKQICFCHNVSPSFNNGYAFSHKIDDCLYLFL